VVFSAYEKGLQDEPYCSGGDDEGIGVVVETSFLKKGTHSVGVARPGVAGKRENGQVATVLSSTAREAHIFLDRQLALPEEWSWNTQRRAQAHVPAEVGFATRPEQAIAMPEHAWEQGGPMRWVSGYSPRPQETVQEHGHLSVLAVSARTRVWTECPQVLAPKARTGRRPRRAPRVAPGAPSARMVSRVIREGHPPTGSDWQSCRE